MSPNNATVFNCSLKKYNQLLRVYGTGNLAELTLLKLIYKYACYSPTEATLTRLDSMISYLQSSNPTICMDTIGDSLYGGIFPEDPSEDPEDPIPDGKNNRPPTVDGKTINIDYNGKIPSQGPQYTLMHSFSIADFTTNFSDPDGDSYGNAVVSSLPAQGFLLYNGQEVSSGSLILNPSLLEYWIRFDGTVEIDTSFTFSISDDNIDNPAWSSEATITLARDADVGDNQAATIGDNSIYADNNVTTVLISSMFTDGNPAYSDPENDPLDSIRIDRIGSKNLGTFSYNGGVLSEGQVISAADLDAGLLIHIGASSNDISSDTLEFSVRDTGSLIWVN